MGDRRNLDYHELFSTHSSVLSVGGNTRMGHGDGVVWDGTGWDRMIREGKLASHFWGVEYWHFLLLVRVWVSVLGDYTEFKMI
jgi:hypothetical protein